MSMITKRWEAIDSNVNGKGVAWKYKQNPCGHPKQPIINDHTM